MTNQPTNQIDESFWDEEEIEEEASKSVGGQASFGKLTITTARRIHFVREGDNVSSVEVDAATFKTLSKRDRLMELSFEVNIQEFRPDLEWNYNRRVGVGGKDWHTLLIPSVNKALGREIGKGTFGTMLSELNGKYVEAVDVPQSKDPEYNTITIVQIFADAAQCRAAWVERYGEPEATVSTTMTQTTPVAVAGVPDGYTAEIWASMHNEILNAKNAGTPVAELATTYGVPVPFIAAIT